MNVEQLRTPGTAYWVFLLGIPFLVASYTIVTGPGLDLGFMHVEIDAPGGRVGYFWSVLLLMGLKVVLVGIPGYLLWKFLAKSMPGRITPPLILFRAWMAMIFMAFGLYGLLIRDTPLLHFGGRLTYLLMVAVPVILLIRFHSGSPTVIRAGRHEDQTPA